MVVSRRRGCHRKIVIMPRVTFVKRAMKPNSVVSQEDIDRAKNPQTEADKTAASYYWWKFRHGGRRESKTYPKRSQLTQSNFLSQLYDLQDGIDERFSEAQTSDDFNSARDEVVAEIENLRDECQESLDNMPESLQYAPTGELLQERIDALENWSSEFENVDCDFDEEDFEDKDEWKEHISNIRDELTSCECEL